MDKKLKKEFMEIMILYILREKGSMHGYSLIEYVRERYGFSPSPSMIYPVLRRLRQKGYVSVEPVSVGLKKIYNYSVTVKGEMFLEEKKELLKKALRYERKLLLARDVGVLRIAGVLKDLFDMIDQLGEDELESLRKEIRGFEARLKRFVR